MDKEILIFILLASVIWIFYRLKKRRREKKRVEEAEKELLSGIDVSNKQNQVFFSFIRQNYLIQSCPICHEFTMRFLDISPNARSIQYQCVHCGKKIRAAAGTPEATQNADTVVATWRALKSLHEVLNNPVVLNNPSKYPLIPLEFETVPAPMPYEQTTRTPIPEAVRSEVWRRDHGRCVNCGSKENLQFDHIIPVSQGGATSAKNLQLLCQSCNLTKSAKI